MMKCLPQVGQTTRGASGNPQPYELEGTGIKVWFSRWVDLMPIGATFEGRGMPPDIEVNESPAAYQHGDPTFEKAIDALRQKVGRPR
jgi:C-terminal processing protease CtpA/Prc